MEKIDPKTGRPYGDHGTAQNAIDFILKNNKISVGETDAFLRCWREGNLDEWPEYYAWLRKQGL